MTEIEEIKNEEYLFFSGGFLFGLDIWGIMLRSSNKDIGLISLKLYDNVFPPYHSHKLIREDAIQIRDYINEYLERTEE